MLVISRRIGERTVLRLEDGREIVVTLVAVERGKVRLGIHCDRAITIFREELRGQFDGSRPAPAPASPKPPWED